MLSNLDNGDARGVPVSPGGGRVQICKMCVIETVYTGQAKRADRIYRPCVANFMPQRLSTLTATYRLLHRQTRDMLFLQGSTTPGARCRLANGHPYESFQLWTGPCVACVWLICRLPLYRFRTPNPVCSQCGRMNSACSAARPKKLTMVARTRHVVS